MKYYSHRGLYDAQKGIVENSQTAFECSIQHGFGIELDVRLTHDCEVVVIHDNHLQRLYGLDNEVEALAYDALNQLTQDTSRIMKLHEVLELVDKRVPLIVELKMCFDNLALCQSVAALLDCYEGEFSIESFHPGIVRWFTKNRPNFKRGQLLMPLGMYRLKLLGIFMTSGITHCITRPQFYAFHVDMGKTSFGRMYYYFLSRRCERVLWTVKKGTVLNFKADAVIFEEN